MYWKENPEDTVRLMPDVMAYETHGNSICFHLSFVWWKMSLHPQIKILKNVKNDMKESRDELFHVFELEVQAFI